MIDSELEGSLDKVTYPVDTERENHGAKHRKLGLSNMKIGDERGIIREHWEIKAREKSGECEGWKPSEDYILRTRQAYISEDAGKLI